jgi:serine/threonine-protein kinase
MWSDASEATILNRVSSGEIPSPLSANPDVPQALADICMKALAPTADDRYATAADFRAALEEWLRLSGSVVSTSDVSEYMTSTFAEFREATRSVVEQHLSAARLSSSHDESSGVAIEVPNLELQAVATEPPRSLSGSRSGVTNRSNNTLTARSGRSAWLAALGVVLLGLAAFLFFARKAEPPPAAAAAATVALSIAASPANATLTLDGERLSTNPFNGRFPRDDKQHSLVVEAAGHVSQTFEVPLNENRSVAVTLVPVPPVVAGAPSAPGSEPSAPARARSPIQPSSGRRPGGAMTAPGRAAGPQPSAATRSTQCTPPFTIDANGFKVYKPGCL